MNRILRIPIVLFLIFTTSLFAQANLSGTVTDNEGSPLAGANVYLVGTDQGSATDSDGNYSIAGVNTGTYTLVVSYLGYTTQELNVNVANSDLNPKSGSRKSFHKR